MVFLFGGIFFVVFLSLSLSPSSSRFSPKKKTTTTQKKLIRNARGEKSSTRGPLFKNAVFSFKKKKTHIFLSSVWFRVLKCLCLFFEGLLRERDKKFRRLRRHFIQRKKKRLRRRRRRRRRQNGVVANCHADDDDDDETARCGTKKTKKVRFICMFSGRDDDAATSEE